MISTLKQLLILARIHQWAKNLFIFLPIFFGGKLFDVDYVLKSFVAFILFCLTASTIYIINDLSDIEKDKLHPEKKNHIIDVRYSLLPNKIRPLWAIVIPKDPTAHTPFVVTRGKVSSQRKQFIEMLFGR